jgi:uncharacterized delta-60 repeat protein
MNQQRWATWVLLAAATGAAACSGDDDDSQASGAETADAGGDEGGSAGKASAGKGGSGGKGGAGGKGGSGVSSDDAAGSGGRAAEGGKGGSGGDDEEEEGTGGKAAAGSGGSSGSDDADAGVDIPAYPAVEKVAERTFTQANDLRGLTYSSTGKIWASGHSDADATNRKLVLARFNADGTPDTSFSDDGFLEYDLVPGDEQSIGLVELDGGDVVVQANVSDGRGGAAIVDAAGAADGVRANGSNVVLARFTSAGQLVASFGQNGIAQLKFGWAPEDDESWPAPTYNSAAAMENQRYSGPGYPTDQAWGVLLDKSGSEPKLVVNGFGPAPKVAADQRYDNDRYVLRVLASTGALDPAFNGGKPYTFHTQAALSDGGRRALVEADGSIVSSGYTNFGEGLGNHVVLLRLKPDGTPDTDFGFGPVAQPGIATFNPFVENGGVAECYAVGRQESGRYITTGYGRATAANTTSKFGYVTTDAVDLVSFALQGDGKAVDTSWGIEGTRAIQSEESGLGGTEDRGRDLLLLNDGRAVQVGRFGVGPAVFVLTPDGQLDPSSGDNGVITYTGVGAMPSHFFAVARSQDGKQLAAATNNNAEGVLLAVLKVND